MNSGGTTLVSQFFMNEREIRNSPSGSSWAIEVHDVLCDGAGAGTIVTDMDKVHNVFVGLLGDTAGNMPAVDLDNIATNADGRFEIPVAGVADTKYNFQLFGNFEGS